MERPTIPRRKSSASEADDGIVKPKQRKSFVVGTKSHHRVPSYGKKLNQLSKLTALTTNEHKPQDTAISGSPRLAQINRSLSQKSLSETRGSRKNGSTSDLHKLRRSSSHHGSTTRLTAIKPATKTENVHDNDGSGLDSSSIDRNHDKTKPKSKRPTFVIEDDDNEDVEDVPSSFANEAFAHEEAIQQAAVAKQTDTSPISRDVPFHKHNSSAQLRQLHARTESVRSPERAIDEQASLRTLTDSRSPAVSSKVAANETGTSSGLLFHANATPVGPQLTTEPAVSRDIQAKERPGSGRSLSLLNASSLTPLNSQPLTSRFLESPGAEVQVYPAPRSVSSQPKDHVGSVSSAVPKPVMTSIYHGSPHGSTTNLGSGSSRTQQKLMLQRASSIYFEGIVDSQEDSKVHSLPSSRTMKEIDRITREYKNVKRFRDPFKELAQRLHASGVVLTTTQPLRRTMTQTTLASTNGTSKDPKISQSSSNLKQTRHIPSTLPSEVDKILQNLWSQDDHITNQEIS